MFHRREKRNPVKAPTKSDGANVPPQPPPPFVAAVANVFVSMTSAMNSMSHLPLPENIELCSSSFQSASLVPFSSTLIAEYPSP